MDRLTNKSMRFLTSYTIVLIALCIIQNVHGQTNLYFIESQYDDSFSQWTIHFDEEEYGQIGLRWPLKNDWTQWSIDVGDYYGTLKQQRLNDPNHWQAKINSGIIDFRATFPGDLKQWTIKFQGSQYKLYMPYTNVIESWTLETKDHYFDIFTSFEGDPRDWSFEESIDNTIPLELKLASITLVLAITTPDF